MGTCRSAKVSPLIAAEPWTIGKDREVACYRHVAVNLIRRLYSFLRQDATSVSKSSARAPLPGDGISRIGFHNYWLRVSAAIYSQAYRILAWLQNLSASTTAAAPSLGRWRGS